MVPGLTWPRPLAAEIMAASGFTWLAVATEHTPCDLALVAHTFRAIEARGAIPLARAWDHDPVTTARLLDAGAWGLIFPHVSTPEQAEHLARAMRYPPRGTRSVGSARCQTLHPDYLQIANEQVLCIPQIEDLEGIENTEAIASVEGVDIGFLGRVTWPCRWESRWATRTMKLPCSAFEKAVSGRGNPAAFRLPTARRPGSELLRDFDSSIWEMIYDFFK